MSIQAVRGGSFWVGREEGVSIQAVRDGSLKIGPEKAIAKIRLQIEPAKRPRNAAMAIIIKVLEDLGLFEPALKFEFLDLYTIFLNRDGDRPLKLCQLNRSNNWDVWGKMCFSQDGLTSDALLNQLKNKSRK